MPRNVRLVMRCEYPSDATRGQLDVPRQAWDQRLDVSLFANPEEFYLFREGAMSGYWQRKPYVPGAAAGDTQVKDYYCNYFAQLYPRLPQFTDLFVKSLSEGRLLYIYNPRCPNMAVLDDRVKLPNSAVRSTSDQALTLRLKKAYQRMPEINTDFILFALLCKQFKLVSELPWAFVDLGSLFMSEIESAKKLEVAEVKRAAEAAATTPF